MELLLQLIQDPRDLLALQDHLDRPLVVHPALWSQGLPARLVSLETLVSLDDQELLEKLVTHLDHLDHPDPADRTEHLASLDLRDLLEMMVSPVWMVLKDLQVLLVRMVGMESREPAAVKMDQKARLDIQADLETTELQASLDQWEPLDLKDPRVSLALEGPVLTAYLEHQEVLAYPAYLQAPVVLHILRVLAKLHLFPLPLPVCPVALHILSGPAKFQLFPLRRACAVAAERPQPANNLARIRAALLLVTLAVPLPLALVHHVALLSPISRSLTLV